jgi:hypothetical protein
MHAFRRPAGTRLAAASWLAKDWPAKKIDTRRDGLTKIQGRHALPLTGGSGDPIQRLVPDDAENASDGAPDGSWALTPKLIVPLGLALSCLAHLAFLTPAFFLAGTNPFNARPEDVIMVDIEAPEEVPKPADQKPPDEKPLDETPPAETTAGEIAKALPPSPPAAPDAQTAMAARAPPQPDPPAVRQPPAVPQALPAPQSPPADGPSAPGVADVFALPLTLPGGIVGYEVQGQGPAVTEKSDIAEDVIAAFRTRLKTCSTLPAGVTAQARVKLRIHLNPDGTLMRGPDQNPHPVGSIHGLTTGGGGELLNAAMAAVRKCQPYSMLPADRYDEWRTLDMTFTAASF